MYNRIQSGDLLQNRNCLAGSNFIHSGSLADFSIECQALESKVMIYCPDAIQPIRNIHDNNLSDELTDAEYDSKQGLVDIVEGDLIPALSDSIISVERNNASKQSN